ncbi:AraC family transcriptional regulator [Desulfatiferula olefinivorans]
MDQIIRFTSHKTLTPRRLINAVLIMARVAERHGIAREVLLAGSGLVSGDLEDPRKHITLLREKAIARRFIDLVNIPWIGLDVGAEYNFSANGKLGMAMMCCDTLLDALKLVLTYLPLTGSYHRYSLTIDGTRGVARFREMTNLDGFRAFCCEAEVGSIQAMAKASRIHSDVFRELHFAYPRPNYAERYEALFDCPIVFNAPENMMVFDAKHLTRPLPLANPLARRALERDCAQMLPLLQAHDSIGAHILQELTVSRDPVPGFDQMARHLGLSPRTLRRRLLAEKTTYTGIVTEFRKARALELIRTTSLTMEQVAARLGFGEVSSFYRAFKAWTGCTPSRFRGNEYHP